MWGELKNMKNFKGKEGYQKNHMLKFWESNLSLTFFLKTLWENLFP